MVLCHAGLMAAESIKSIIWGTPQNTDSGLLGLTGHSLQRVKYSKSHLELNKYIFSNILSFGLYLAMHRSCSRLGAGR